MSEIDIFNGYGVLIKLKKQDDFLKVKETLTRIGIASRKEKVLYQSCHILHKQGQYAIMHFKELFALDHKPTDISSSDLARRDTIANLLNDWGLLEIISNTSTLDQDSIYMSQIKIISFKEKNDWTLTPKYAIGKKFS